VRMVSFVVGVGKWRKPAKVILWESESFKCGFQVHQFFLFNSSHPKQKQNPTFLVKKSLIGMCIS